MSDSLTFPRSLCCSARLLPGSCTLSVTPAGDRSWGIGEGCETKGNRLDRTREQAKWRDADNDPSSMRADSTVTRTDTHPPSPLFHLDRLRVNAPTNLRKGRERRRETEPITIVCHLVFRFTSITWWRLTGIFRDSYKWVLIRDRTINKQIFCDIFIEARSQHRIWCSHLLSTTFSFASLFHYDFCISLISSLVPAARWPLGPPNYSY